MPPIKSYNRILDEHLHSLITQGNHEAYLKLARRYRLYAKHLTQEILEQYQGSGVSFSDIMAVFSSHFRYVVRKYDQQQTSFYSFWKESSEKVVMDYLIENSYSANAKAFRGFIHFDEEDDEKRTYEDRIHENDKDYFTERLIRELKRLLKANKIRFKNLEFTILYLLLDGYTIADLEHSGIMSRAGLYLTFNNACKKMKRIVQTSRKK